MKPNLGKEKEFISFFRKLQEQKSLSYTKAQFFKLKTYDILLFDSFLWKYRDFYLKLLLSFLNYTISPEEFSQQFFAMRSNHIDKFNELMNQFETNFEFLNEININLNAFGFAKIIDLVDQDCDSFVSDEFLLEEKGVRENGEINENQFRKRIEKRIKQLKELENI